jgi:hypothetical protein
MIWNSVNHGLMKSAQNYYIEESKLNCNGCRIQAKNGDDLNNNITFRKRGNTRNKKLMSLKQIVRTKVLETHN